MTNCCYYTMTNITVFNKKPYIYYTITHIYTYYKKATPDTLVFCKLEFGQIDPNPSYDYRLSMI